MVTRPAFVKSINLQMMKFDRLALANLGADEVLADLISSFTPISDATVRERFIRILGGHNNLPVVIEKLGEVASNDESRGSVVRQSKPRRQQSSRCLRIHESVSSRTPCRRDASRRAPRI
ncbi:MAG: hypothetical protein M2R46_01696 [Verrucomicrobia subdivision 3 bacterium]|nr:hypothetical protein [Limisphaerales bacterium]